MRNTLEYWSAVSPVQNERGSDDPEIKCFVFPCFRGEYPLDYFTGIKIWKYEWHWKKKKKMIWFSASNFLQAQVRQNTCWSTEAVWISCCSLKKAPAKYWINFFLAFSVRSALVLLSTIKCVIQFTLPCCSQISQ